jgi:2-polyprenyl-3-methyl-5-hydroxy-6-metoxy-1,4-benzoquinol methylase
MTNKQYLEALAEPYVPRKPLEDLVIELNKLYHKHESATYDDSHPEVHEQLPSLWQAMLEVVAADGTSPARVLDYGCGTGFEAEQIIRTLGADRVAAITCYDTSAAMLDKCREKISRLFPGAVYSTDLDEALEAGAPYNLLATNSLLHHLPSPASTIRALSPALAPDTRWILGHEPSCRYYRSAACLSLLEEYQQERRIGKYLRPRNYWAGLKRVIRPADDPGLQAARDAVAMGLFERKPPSSLIGRFVDFQVAHSAAEAESGRGFDIDELQASLADSWRVCWFRSYSYMGQFYEGSLPRRWQDRCRELAAGLPRDGANFCCVWRRAPQQ